MLRWALSWGGRLSVLWQRGAARLPLSHMAAHASPQPQRLCAGTREAKMPSLCLQALPLNRCTKSWWWSPTKAARTALQSTHATEQLMEAEGATHAGPLEEEGGGGPQGAPQQAAKRRGAAQQHDSAHHLHTHT